MPYAHPMNVYSVSLVAANRPGSIFGNCPLQPPGPPPPRCPPPGSAGVPGRIEASSNATRSSLASWRGVAATALVDCCKSATWAKASRLQEISSFTGMDCIAGFVATCWPDPKRFFFRALIDAHFSLDDSNAGTFLFSIDKKHRADNRHDDVFRLHVKMPIALFGCVHDYTALA